MFRICHRKNNLFSMKKRGFGNIILDDYKKVAIVWALISLSGNQCGKVSTYEDPQHMRTHSIAASEKKVRWRFKRIRNGEDLQDFQIAQFCPTLVCLGNRKSMYA